jgi:hypothetical protein
MSSILLNEPLLDEKLAQLEEARSWSSRVISKLETTIRTADDYALFRVNPVQYAKDKGMAENEAIDLFLYGTKVGRFEEVAIRQNLAALGFGDEPTRG